MFVYFTHSIKRLERLAIISYQLSVKKGCRVWEICCWLLVVGCWLSLLCSPAPLLPCPSCPPCPHFECASVNFVSDSRLPPAIAVTYVNLRQYSSHFAKYES
ncbi:hypothetical protein C7Y66_15995 [Chroococcidiopsis sp. CCALA 051]|nr:hypothetical protein C7Y66_15995 [Chroococcidiopsis sp. CCALA 051]